MTAEHTPPICQTSTPVRGQPIECIWPECDCLPRGEWAELILNEHAQEVTLETAAERDRLAKKVERLRGVNAELMTAVSELLQYPQSATIIKRAGAVLDKAEEQS